MVVQQAQAWQRIRVTATHEEVGLWYDKIASGDGVGA